MAEALNAAQDDLIAGDIVLELSTRAAGAYAGRLLELMGAEVRRIDAPLSLDCPDDLLDDVSYSLNHGKASVAYDASRLSELLAGVDVIIVDSLHDDAFDGVWMSRSRELVAAAGAAIPVVDVSAYRSTSDPTFAEHEPATPYTAAAAGGMSWSMGHPSREPIAPPYDLADYFAGAEAAGAAVTALLMRDAGVEGAQRWDVSAADAVGYYTGQINSNFIYYERPWHRDGRRATMSGGFYPSAMFPTKDGYITLVCRSPREWDALREAMGRPEWAYTPDFEDARVVARLHADRADEHIAVWTRQHTSREIAEIADQHNLPNALILTPNESMALEQFRVHRLFSEDREGRASIPDRFWRVIDPPKTEAAPKPLRLEPTARQPLAGLRILDLTWVWAGPMTTGGLAELGAEVIKVESSVRPDSSRLRGAAIRNGKPVQGPERELSPYFNQMNRGKRSTTINITSPEGAELVRRMAEQCDVVIENMRPGALERRGLDYATLAARNPGIIMVSLAMMGQGGPMSGIGGYAPVMSGLAGLDAITGYSAEDLIGNFNPSPGDPNGADHATALLIAALIRRRRTGRGCWLDVSQIEALMSTMRVPFAIAARGESVPVPGNAHNRYAPHGTYRCLADDSWIAVAVRTDAERGRLAVLLGTPSADPLVLESALRDWAATTPVREVESRLRAEGIAAHELIGITDLIEGDLARARELHHVYDHEWLGPQKIFGIPWKLNGRGFFSSRSAPGLGAHNRDVLVDEFGLIDETTLARYESEHVLE